MNYGQDTGCTSDLPLVDAQVFGVELVANAIYRRLTTPTGALALIGDDPSYGWPIQNLINAAIGPSSISSYQAAIRSQCLKDDRVSDCSVLLSFSQPNLNIAIGVVLSDGTTFDLVVGVNQLTAQTFYQVQS